MSSRPDIIYNEYGMDTGYMDRLRKQQPKAMWVKNYYGGSDLYSPTMNGDVRTVIQGCPTLWFREVAGYPNRVACMEFNELSAVISRENWQIAVDRVYAADAALRAGDPDRVQYKLHGPLERPEQEGPWRMELPTISRPRPEDIPSHVAWRYVERTRVPKPMGTKPLFHTERKHKPSQCMTDIIELYATMVDRRGMGSSTAPEDRQPLPLLRHETLVVPKVYRFMQLVNEKRTRDSLAAGISERAKPRD
ncbi:hypothetical protein D6D28_06000 [Aureobasidium pullulans]|uniref:Uncharacterized protein n=1 Tax=Aureobasidium pullulans TaxID=5580 RepID=A0A4S8SFU7_AURPU|nr:hypothetical protein D6D28_06000 [Aureobasidium pullulans]